MNLQLWTLGKENGQLLDPVLNEYITRIKRYTSFDMVQIDNSRWTKSLPRVALLQKESEIILGKLNSKDWLILLDERGKTLRSLELADHMNQWMNRSPARIIFLIGGSFGVSEEMKSRADFILSLSALTFPHQMVRLLIAEQVYRAFSILKNEKYHHE